MKLTGKQRWAKTRHALFAAFALLTPLTFSASSVAESPSTSGIGDDGVGSGVMSIVSADEDYSLSLNGSNQWAVGSDASVFDLSSQLTFEAWLKPTSAAGCFILKRGAYEMCLDSSGYWFGLDDNAGAWNWYPNSGVKARLGEWQHFAFVKNGSSATFLLDGQVVWTATNAL